jgi:hypothetical protein
LLLLGQACRQSSPAVPVPKISDSARAQRALALPDSCRPLLHNGCLVLRLGNDVISSMFAQFNRIDKGFSHCGLAFRENGQWVVYHSIGGESNPDAVLRRDTWERFISRENNFAFGLAALQLNPTETQRLAETVRGFYAQRIRFDMQFDLGTDNRFYCAEMVYKALRAATGDDSLIRPTRNGRFVFVSTDNLFTHKRAQMLCRVKY